MSDTRRMLAEMADPLFAELGADATMDRDGARLEQLGLPALLVALSEFRGVFGPEARQKLLQAAPAAEGATGPAAAWCNSA